MAGSDRNGGNYVAAEPTVIIYSLTTCTWCTKAKDFFRQRGIFPYVIEFEMAGLELKRKMAAEMRHVGGNGFPFVKIGGYAVSGYDPERYEKLLTRARSDLRDRSSARAA
jgi:glutaredoxin 3